MKILVGAYPRYIKPHIYCSQPCFFHVRFNSLRKRRQGVVRKKSSPSGEAISQNTKLG